MVVPASAWRRLAIQVYRGPLCTSKTLSLWQRAPGGDLTCSQVVAARVMADSSSDKRATEKKNLPCSHLIRCHTWGGWMFSVCKRTWLPQQRNQIMLGMKRPNSQLPRGDRRTPCCLLHLRAHVKQALDWDPVCEGNWWLCSPQCSSVWCDPDVAVRKAGPGVSRAAWSASGHLLWAFQRNGNNLSYSKKGGRNPS